ncbi:MAG TPA: YceI family protein [Rhodanobacteraceae bacterium]|jgi:polyisoprenoid-binding protein YceI|nr:YceI family protein [Rhodanobacteraceae bacterium]
MRYLVATLAALLVASPLMASPTTYRYDTEHSQILFSADHNGYSNPVGRLHIASGWLRFDMDDWSHAATELDIDLASVDMGDKTWNAALRAGDFLATGQARLAHFVSTSVTRSGPRTGVLHGTLTLRGVSRPLDIAFTLNREGMTVFGMHTVIGFSATATLDRDAFGITGNPGSIGHQVHLRLEIEAIREP